MAAVGRCGAAAALLLLVLTIAGGASAGVGAEFPLTTPVYLPNPQNQKDPAIAAGATHHLAVWTDDRTGGKEIRGARIRPSGYVEERGSFAIASSPKAVFEPAVAWDGSGWLVVWADLRNGSFDNSGPEPVPVNLDLYMVRVSASGALTGPPVAITTAPGNQRHPAVAWNGREYLVAWTAVRSDNQDTRVTRIRLGAGGRPVVVDPPAGYVVAGGPRPQLRPAVAAAATAQGAPFLVAWWDARDVRGTQFDLYGTLVSRGKVVTPDGAPIAAAETAHELVTSAAATGTGFAVGWTRQATGGAFYDAYLTRVVPNGTGFDVTAHRLPGESGYQFAPVLAAAGKSVVAAWSNEFRRAMLGTRIAVSAVPPVNLGSWRPFTNPVPGCASYLGGRTLVVWEDAAHATRSDIVVGNFAGARVLAAGPSSVLSVSAATEHSPAVAFDGTNYLGVWADQRGNDYGPAIYGARFDASGAGLDGSGVKVSTGADFGQMMPAVAWGGSSYLTVWLHQKSASATGTSEIQAARISPAGAVLDSPPLVLATTSTATLSIRPSVAATGSGDFLVAWTDRTPATLLDVRARRVRSDGTLPDPAFLVAGGPEVQGVPALASDGTGFLALYVENPPRRVMAALVSIEGLVGPAHAVSTSAGATSPPAVAWNGESYAALWREQSGPVYSLQGALVGRDGTPLGPPQPQSGPNALAPTGAWDGARFVVVWGQTGVPAMPAFALQAQELATDLAPPTTAPTLVADAGGSGLYGPAGGYDITAGPPGRIAVVYRRRADEPRYGGVSRLFVRFLDH